jgi:hypothetical protein
MSQKDHMSLSDRFHTRDARMAIHKQNQEQKSITI